MNREQTKERIKEVIPCTDLLKPAPDHRGNSGYCCDACGSGTHRGGHSTGAVTFYPDSNTWYCHACGAGGDVIDLYRIQENCDFNTAIDHLSEKAGIIRDHHKYDGPGSPQIDEKTFNDTEVQADYTEYYKACCSMLKDPAAVNYITGRGISIETAETYGLGYDPKADPANAPGAIANEYKLHPAPRIIIPCSTAHYVARSTDPNAPKYKALNPSKQKGAGGVSLFNKEALYNGAEIVFITEGIFDALSIIEAGHDAVALHSNVNGKLLLDNLQDKETQAAFIICFDNDESPQTKQDTEEKAAALCNELQSRGHKSIVYNVAGQYHDINDALQADPEALKRNIDAAIWALPDDITAFFDKIQTDAYRPNKTGLTFFDNELLQGGIINQSLLLLMAPPGTGKTTLAQQLAETIAEKKQPVIYFNFEMSREQMLAKAISAKLYQGGGIKKTATQILQGYAWPLEERPQIEETINEYRKNNYPYIKYNPPGSSSELKDLLTHLETVGQEAKEKGEQAPAVVVDYLHLIKSRDNLDTQELIKQAVTGLKQYAVDHNTFVIAIVATNRISNKGGRLTMESGRDSSNLEYTADYQISLNYYDIDTGDVKPDDTKRISDLQQEKRRTMILRVLKSRFSQPGREAVVTFDAEHNIFYDGFIPDKDARSFDDAPPVRI